MAYKKKVWIDSPSEQVTYEDMNRIESGISTNDANVTAQATTIASQGQQISILSANALQKAISMPSNTHTNTCYETGIYKCVSWIGYPPGLPDGQGTLIVYGYEGNGWFKQVFISPHNNKTYVRVCVNEVFSGWEEEATSYSTPCTMYNGWTGSVRATRTGNLVNFYGRVSGGLTTIGTQILSTPFSFNVEYMPIFQTAGSHQGWVYSFAGGIFVHSLSTNSDLCLSVTIAIQ